MTSRRARGGAVGLRRLAVGPWSRVSYVLYVIGHFAPIVRDARAAALAFICTGAHTKALEMDISHRHKRA